MGVIDRSAEYRSFAERQAAAFGQATMAKISAALAEHNAAVVAFACEMQVKLDRANVLLCELGACHHPNHVRTKWDDDLDKRVLDDVRELHAENANGAGAN